MKYKDQLITLLTDEQTQAIESLEQAFKECKRANIYIHNCNGVLRGYNGKFIDNIGMDPSDIGFDEIGIDMNIEYDLDSWSDDNNYIHLNIEAVELERENRRIKREAKKIERLMEEVE